MPSVFEKEFRISQLAVIVFFTGIIIYSFSFTVSFNNDEIAFIQRTEIKTVDNLISLCGKQEFDGVYYRPLGDVISGFITLAIKYYTPGYRVINAVLNAINGILLFLTGLYVLRTTPHRKAISFWAAIFFLLHPINNYAVIWHTALFERVFLSFYLLALLLFLKKGQWGVLSLISFLAALMSKEMAFSFPFVIFLVSFYLNKKNGIKKALSDFMPYAILTFLFIAFRIISFNNNVFTNQEAHSYISFFAIIKNYLFFIGAMIFPFFLKDVESFLQMHNYIIFIIIPFAGLLSYWIYKKYDKKLLSLIFLLTIVSILPASRLFMRWYLYLPSVFFCLGLSYLINSINSYRNKMIILTILICSYLSVNIYNQLQWAKVSHQGDDIITQLKNDYSSDLQGSKTIIFVNLPAKINDIPLFQLGFDYHLNYYLKSNNKCIFIAKEVMQSVTDSIMLDVDNNILRITAEKGNSFLPGDNVRYANISVENRLNNTIYLNLQKIENGIVFIFNHGKFIKIKDN